MNPYYDSGEVIIFHGDCREILPQLAADPDCKYKYDFLLTDPPYGIEYDNTESKHHNPKAAARLLKTIIGDKDFDARQLESLSVPSIIWGANCFASSLTDHPGWLTWLKTATDHVASPSGRGVKLRKADMELAWTNFIRRPQAYIMFWIGVQFDEAIGKAGNEQHHPTCKPVELMKWCLDLAPKECSTVLDPYMGGGSTLVAAAALTGWRGVGIELEERYCEMAANRLSRCDATCKVPRNYTGIGPSPKNSQPALF
jgi:DNA modification methylase